MRKNINKLVAMAIGISVMSGSIIPAFAADATQQTSTNTATASTQIVNGKPLFTLDDAIKAAISKSDTLDLDNQKISYQDKINDTNEKLDDATGVNDDQVDFNKDTRDNSLNQLKQLRDFDQDKLIQQTTTAYNGIVTSQLQLGVTAKSLEIQNKLLSDASLKNSLGLMTNVDLTSNQLQIETLKNQQKSAQNALSDAEYNFKQLTGKDVTQYSLQQDIPYDGTFKIDGTIDDYLDNTIDSYLKYKTEALEINKDYYNDKDNNIPSSKFTIDEVTNSATMKGYEDDADQTNMPPKPSDIETNLKSYQDYLNDMNAYTGKVSKYTGALAAKLTYLSTKLNIKGNEVSLNETKKQFKEQLRSVYTNLLTTEDSITTLKKNIDLNNKQLSNAKLKYDLGLITKSDYDTQALNNDNLNLQLRTSVNNYNTLKEEIQKPWIIFS